MLRSLLTAVLGVALWMPAALAAQQRPMVEDLLARGQAYVAEFVKTFSNVVAEERYAQRLIQERRNRNLGSDFLIVQVPGTTVWQSFRDVFEVDGKPVRDRDDRLQKLFLEEPGSAVGEAREIAQASAQFNLPGIGALNDPLAALAFLQQQYQVRFRWSLVRNERDLGPNVWSVRFQENQRPTIFLGAGNRDMPANGQIWLEADTGRIVKTELRVDRPGTAITSSFGVTTNLRGLSEVITTYQFDDRFGINVPVETQERHITGVVEVTGTAKYSRFRRFGVSVQETIGN
jgi:hypothetical protein